MVDAAIFTPSVVKLLTLEMSRAHVFMTWTDPYPSQQTHNPTYTHNPS